MRKDIRSYKLDSFTPAELDDLAATIAARCRDVLNIEIGNGTTLNDILQTKYKTPEVEIEGTVKDMLYLIFINYGEKTNMVNEYSNMIYNYCIGIVAIDRFLKKLQVRRDSFPVVIDYYKVFTRELDKTDKDLLVFRFGDINASDPSNGEFLTFKIQFTLFSPTKDWQQQIATFATEYNGRNEPIQLSNLVAEFKDFWNKYKEF